MKRGRWTRYEAPRIAAWPECARARDETTSRVHWVFYYMRIQFAPRLVAALVAATVLAACGGNGSSGTSIIPAGTAGAQSATRAVQSVPQPLATPTHDPCYCPPHQRICPDIACTTSNEGRTLPNALQAAPAAPAATPYPPCYCPPSRIPHYCSDCAVSALPDVTARDPHFAWLGRRRALAAGAA